ncbi:MAG: hypothetical protein AAB507_00465 [Patescibacteria group bacterium]
MKIKLSITQKLLVPPFVVLALVGVILSYRINSILRQEATENAQNIIADFIGIHSGRHITSPADFSFENPKETNQIFSKLFEEVKTSNVIRIKVWAKDGTVIFSDDKSIVGQNFASNKDFQKSIGGEVAVVIKAPLDPENVTEKGYEQLMEVYVPIELQAGEGPIGVVETYYTLDSLNASILKTQREISLVVTLGFLLLALGLWLSIKFVVVKPLKGLEEGIIGIRERERE